MSASCFCCSLPAGFGYPGGQGTPDIFRRTATPPAQTSRLIRWNKYRGPAVPITSSPSPSPGASDGEIPTSSSPSPSPVASGGDVVFNLKGWVTVSQSVERHLGVSSSADPKYIKAPDVPDNVTTIEGSSTGVHCKDIVIFPDTGVSVRFYLPKIDGSPRKRKYPILVYFHGGGFLIESTGSPHYHNFLTRLAANSGVLVISVDYRLAPEHPIPAAYDDSMAALNWVVSHSAGTGPESWLTDHGDFRQLFVAGDSAGGNLTHYVAMHADAGANIEGVALVHPYFFGKRPVGKEEDDTANMLFHSKLWPFIAPDSEGLDDPRVNPFGPRAPSLNRLKCNRAIVVVAGDDFHLYRGRMYYDTLKKSGWKGTAAKVEQEGVGHCYFLDDYECPEWVELMTQLVAFLRGEQVDFERSGPITFTSNEVVE